MSTSKIVRSFSKIRNFSSATSKVNGSESKGNVNKSKKNLNKTDPSPSPSGPNVQGLSDNVVKIPNEPVGPGASKTTNYQNPEYFCYDQTSYYEAEVEMLKYRCPQPSAFKYYEHTNPK